MNNHVNKKNSTFGTIVAYISIKLDGVGPVDNIPSPDKLHHFGRKKERKKRKKCDM